MSKKFRVFATCDIGESIELLRKRGYEVEVYPDPQAPPKKLIIEKVKSGIDGLITTLRDPIKSNVLAARQGTLKVVAQFAVGFNNIHRADTNRYKIPFTITPDGKLCHDFQCAVSGGKNLGVDGIAQRGNQ